VEQRRVARWHPELVGETVTGLAAEGDADLRERGEQAVAATRTGGDEGGKALTKGPPRAGRGATEEAADVDHEGDGATAAGKIGDATLVAAMDERRGLLTERTGDRVRCRAGDERETVAFRRNVDDAQPAPLREESGEIHNEDSLARPRSVRRSVENVRRFHRE
jgi:hypothetical protein